MKVDGDFATIHKSDFGPTTVENNSSKNYAKTQMYAS